MDHHLTSMPPSPMENSTVGLASKTPTPASMPNSLLALVPSSRHVDTRVCAGVRPDAGLPHRLQRPLHPQPHRTNLALFDLAPSPSAASSHEGGPGASSRSTLATSPYCTLLRVALFGPNMPDRVASSATACSSSSSPGPSPVGTLTTGNIFRFKTEVRQSAKRALFQERKRRTRCSLAFSPRGVQDQGRSQGCPTRCWMRLLCRTTSTSTSSIGLHIMSSLLGWAIVFTCGMHAAAKSPSFVIWGWMTMFVLWGGRSVALT
ncbi:unnamed protein product [Miscanthus lutarioriparius]|uniref:Uncharacterized protein n=1 Tax=Miscanthus lutarioriparius TaxID=422564 RepID=A0A811PYW6_9POAL|nr:unnamed protein product [Miscanthus lutarioriparius]